MPTLIEHPKHGRTHVYTPLELEKHKAMGWREVNAPQEKPSEAPKKRGRPKGK